MNGTVEALTLDWRGATLLTAVGSVLTVDDIADFDEEGGWLTIADAAPLEYVAVDEDADTVTLTGTAGTVEAGDPVSIWDPTVPPTGAKVVEYLASVMTDLGPVDAVLEHEKIPLAGVDTLIGASVSLTEDDYGTVYIDQVLGREPLLDGSFIDPTTAPTGQAFSLDAPTATDGYPEGYGWWQVDADGDVLGFWRLVGGVWTSQAIVTAEALKANNVLVDALTGTTLTGTTIQTRATSERGIKLGDVSGVESFIIYNESGVPFIKAVPAEGLAVIAGEVKANSLTVAPTSTEEGTSLGGVTEITRHPDGTAGVVRLTGYTTPPKSAPTVTTGYDTTQFTDDGKWADRYGWATDGTYWYTVNNNTSTGFRVQKWTAAGVLSASSEASGDVTSSISCVVNAGKVYVLFDRWFVYQYDASTLAYEKQGSWPHADGTRVPAIGVDSATGELLIAQSRPSDATIPNRVRIRRYTMPVGSFGTLTAGASVDTDFAYPYDLAGVAYGSFDLGANRYVFTARSGESTFRVVNTSGAAVAAENWEAPARRVGFAYTGGAFVTIDWTGTMRTFTGQDKATAIGDGNLTKWVSNTLANVTYETTQSPKAKVTIPKRTKLNVTTSTINTGGTNAPDRVKVFVGQGSTSPARTAMWKQAGLLSGTVLPNLATNPSFESGATGWAAVSGSTAPVASTEQSWVGAQSLKTQRGAGTAIQIASRTITTLLTAGAGQYSYAIRVWIPASVPTTGNTGVRISGAGTTTQDKDTDLRDQWVTLSGTFTWDGSGAVILYSLDSAITAGITIYLDGFHLVAGSTVPTIYGEGSGAPSDTPVGITSGYYTSLATSGTNPPSTNGFQAAAGTIQQLQLADSTVFLDGVGNGTVGTGTFRDSVRTAVMGDYAAGAWTAYTPTFTAATTNPTTANFTRTGRYTQRGKTVSFSIVITCNSTTGLGVGNYDFGLPVPARTLDEVVVLGIQTAPSRAYNGRCPTTTSEVRLFLTSDFTAASNTTTGMASGTTLRISGTYEAA